MGKWEPVIWILASGFGFLALLMGFESLKARRKKK
jgi:hypothetical protein